MSHNDPVKKMLYKFCKCTLLKHSVSVIWLWTQNESSGQRNRTAVVCYRSGFQAERSGAALHVHTWCSCWLVQHQCRQNRGPEPLKTCPQVQILISTLHSPIRAKFRLLFFCINFVMKQSSGMVSKSVGKSYVAIEKIWSPTQSYKASYALIPRTLHASVLSNHHSTFFLPHGIVIHSKQCNTFFYV